MLDRSELREVALDYDREKREKEISFKPFKTRRGGSANELLHPKCHHRSEDRGVPVIFHCKPQNMVRGEKGIDRFEIREKRWKIEEQNRVLRTKTT